jgi:hypothetical protein
MTNKQKILFIIMWIAAILAFLFWEPINEELNNLYMSFYGVI